MALPGGPCADWLRSTACVMIERSQSCCARRGTRVAAGAGPGCSPLGLTPANLPQITQVSGALEAWVR